MVREELSRGAAALAEAGCDTPRLDAELLLAEVLGVSRAGLVTGARDPVDDRARWRFEELLDRRIRREPVAYILGRRDFRGLTLSVDGRVLIPRPESELLVEVAVELLPQGGRVADVGTGSGAVALALKDERPDLEVTGLDVSDDALAVASANGERLGLDVRWISSDLLDDGGYDAVVANLPYVSSREPLAPEIVDYEPSSAVFAGEEGTELVRRLVAQAGSRDEVRLVSLEIGAGQADAVASLLSNAGFGSVARRRDLAGIERVIVGRR
ncbi:MAG TPA: peptide chain release factor N(5)-glutamine methyltransferase [Solirubrobacteraceae bacterium]|jgi:release factor glutamine methyltransferase|nr:peptide chain release factor N(5)-glutamine methyltransferase [Solirubrobacteraceae bacterium]